ncbi:Ku protein [Patulibacter medicamentivorans]|uniref:non-homologous end joining protein Ku n=1 Tax=Patulibacter medicamentivorans TaxID=1097667 RepID=UPI0002FB4472|nr:Ku protein [Patulibacter medicamentivorans]
MAAARSIWNGTLTFGSVAIPIKLFTATEARGLSFREVRESDGARIQHKRIGAESGEEVAFKEIEKAYDTGRGQVILTKEEIAAADGPRAKVVEIEHFVHGEEIDPVFYDKPYHLGARDGGDHGYRVLLAALEQSGRVGIGRFVLRQREQLVALRPLQGALGLQTMRFADELVDPDDLELPSLRKKPGDREVRMAGKLVAMLADEWKPEEHRDSYREAILEMIERKRTGKAPKAAPKAKQADDDLLAALEASLDAGGRSGSGEEPARRAAKTASADAKASAARKRATAAKAKSKPAAAKPSRKAKS